MRLPLAIPIDSRTGTVTKDGRLTNVVVEKLQSGVTVAATRPRVVAMHTVSGNAGGLSVLNGELISVFGTDLYKGGTSSPPVDSGNLVAGQYDFAQSSV